MSREIEQYMRQIERRLCTCSRKRRKAFLQELHGNINDYVREHSLATFPEIQNFFGTPETVAEQFLQSGNFHDTKRVVSLKKWGLQVLVATVCVLVAGFLIWSTLFLADYYNVTHGYAMEEPAQEGNILPDTEALASY